MRLRLFHLLADGKIHSGEKLGAELGISRAAVWKQVAALRDRGVEIEVVPGKGYRLSSEAGFWSADELLAKVSPTIAQLISLLRTYECVTSTNNVAAELMIESQASGVVCLAEEQTEGRGRRGRKWFSPLSNNFYCSIGWIFSEGVSQIEGLSLAIGVAIARALQRYGVVGVKLKWPNDLLIGNAKLGGVLIELEAEAAGPCRVVIGIGLNIFLPPAAHHVLGRPVIDISSFLGRPVKRHELGALLIEEVIRLLNEYPAQGFLGVREEWLSYDAFKDAEVVVAGLGERIAGIARGVDKHGALMLDTAQGLRLIHSGEVSLRNAAE